MFRRADPDRRAAPALSRRELIGVGLGLGLAVVTFGACGSDGGSSRSTVAPSAPTAPTTPATRTVQTAKGAVEVPADPQRVVAIQPTALATLLDVGMSVVGTYDEGEQYVSPRYLDAWKAAPKIGSGELDLEKIAVLEPDLIVGMDYAWNTDSYDQLTAIAPTVIAPSTGWQDAARTIADAVGRTSQLDELAAQAASHEARIRSTYAARLATERFAILQGGFDAGQFWVYGPGSDAGSILAGAGVQFASASAGVSGPANQVFSYEQIDVLDDATAIGFYAGFDDQPNNEGPALFEQPTFQRLPAVTSNHLVPMPDFLPGGYGDALALLDQLEAGLKAMG